MPVTETGCYIWLGDTGRYHYGFEYGRFKLNGKRILAHRAAYILAHGEIPDEMSICHHCDTPLCVNPAHLFAGTQRDNIADMHAKGRYVSRRGIPNKHPSIRRGMPINVGEENPRSKLTKQDVRFIKKFKDEFLQRELAEMFGVSEPTISDIWRGATWKHVSAK